MPKEGGRLRAFHEHAFAICWDIRRREGLAAPSRCGSVSHEMPQRASQERHAHVELSVLLERVDASEPGVHGD